MNQKIEKVISNLNKNNIAGYFVDGHIELFALLSRLIAIDSSVGCGDSATLEETDIFRVLTKRKLYFLR